ncbi:hypothetical protein OH76DRAFT_49237 [Lentinus brumalis]|uniref:Uncharacterized protein n=1 Tax=Lentinus brumalis TaxID=2498619 RepID=A0A371DY97_9APHY|nr:hypothetical protein OH76DRAFT_49237 [Polyporus brumalis]
MPHLMQHRSTGALLWRGAARMNVRNQHRVCRCPQLNNSPGIDLPAHLPLYSAARICSKGASAPRPTFPPRTAQPVSTPIVARYSTARDEPGPLCPSCTRSPSRRTLQGTQITTVLAPVRQRP